MVGDLAKGDVGKAGGNRLGCGEGKRLEQGFCLGQAEQAWTREEGEGRMEIEHSDLLKLAPDWCLSLGRTWSLGQEEGVH